MSVLPVSSTCWTRPTRRGLPSRGFVVCVHDPGGIRDRCRTRRRRWWTRFCADRYCAPPVVTAWSMGRGQHAVRACWHRPDPDRSLVASAHQQRRLGVAGCVRRAVGLTVDAVRTRCPDGRSRQVGHLACRARTQRRCGQRSLRPAPASATTRTAAGVSRAPGSSRTTGVARHRQRRYRRTGGRGPGRGRRTRTMPRCWRGDARRAPTRSRAFDYLRVGTPLVGSGLAGLADCQN